MLFEPPKVALALVLVTRRLRPYFVAHRVVVRTNQPIRKILHRPDLEGRIIEWAIKFYELRIKYQARTTLKEQVLVGFLVEMTSSTPTEPEDLLWSIHVDGSFNSKGSGASLIIENCDKIFVEVSLAFSFATSNNQAEYEVCIAGLLLAKDFNVSQVKIITNSLLVVS